MFLQKFLILLLALGGLWFGVPAVLGMFASDEARIEKLIRGMESGFNDARLNPCMRPIALDWRHNEFDVSREMIADGLRHSFFTARDPATRMRSDRVEVDESTLRIQVDGDTATMTAEVRFEELRGSSWEIQWHTRIEAQLEKRDEGWRIVRTTAEDLAGERF